MAGVRHCSLQSEHQPEALTASDEKLRQQDETVCFLQIPRQRSPKLKPQLVASWSTHRIHSQNQLEPTPQKQLGPLVQSQQLPSPSPSPGWGPPSGHSWPLGCHPSVQTSSEELRADGGHTCPFPPPRCPTLAALVSSESEVPHKTGGQRKEE